MPAERLSMRKIRDVLRLRFGSRLSEREIGRSLLLSNGSVNSYLQRARLAGLDWPLPADLDDGTLERLLFPPPPTPETARARALPDWTLVDKEMRRKGVTMALLWEEYRAAHPDGFGYSWFCENYAAFKSRLRPSMRQSHAAGEKVFVDFAGDTIDVVDPVTGEVRPMKLFVAVMGASNYIFAQARPSEQIADWIGAHVDLLAFLGVHHCPILGSRTAELKLKGLNRRLKVSADRESSRLDGLGIRIWGEEFAIILLDCSVANAAAKAEQIRGRLHDRTTAAGLPVTVSLGVASIPETCGGQLELIPQADAALYAAKQQGRDRVVVAPLRTPARSLSLVETTAAVQTDRS